MTRCIDCGGEIVEGESHHCHTRQAPAGYSVAVRSVAVYDRALDISIREELTGPDTVHIEVEIPGFTDHLTEEQLADLVHCLATWKWGLKKID